MNIPIRGAHRIDEVICKSGVVRTQYQQYLAIQLNLNTFLHSLQTKHIWSCFYDDDQSMVFITLSMFWIFFTEIACFIQLHICIVFHLDPFVLNI